MAAVAAEDAGFGDVWVAEHHFMSYGICPSAITPGEVKATCNGASAAGSPPVSCMGHGAVLEEPAASDITGPREAEFRATFHDKEGDESGYESGCRCEWCRPAVPRTAPQNGDA